MSRKSKCNKYGVIHGIYTFMKDHIVLHCYTIIDSESTLWFYINDKV